MKSIDLNFLLLLVLAFSCSPHPDLTKAKEEIRKAEAAFVIKYSPLSYDIHEVKIRQ